MHPMDYLDAWLHLQHSMKLKQQPLCDASSSHAMWVNHDTPSMIGWMQINYIDLHPSVSSLPLIKDQSSDWTVMPNFCLFILPLFDDVKHS